MTITLTYRDLLLTLLTVLAACGVAYFIAVLRRVSTAVAELQKTLAKVGDLTQRIHHLADNFEEAVSSGIDLARKGSGILGDVQDVTARARGVAVEGLDSLSSILAPLRYLAILINSFSSAFALFAPGGGSEDQEQSEDKED